MTQNNHDSMKTVVETFLIEETESLIYDNEKLEKWNALVEELQLAGQKTIVKPDKSPIPFMSMNRRIKAIVETLCPAELPVEKYHLTPIPVELLDLVALSKREGYFTQIFVRYDEVSPDPFIVGRVGKMENVSWRAEPYLNMPYLNITAEYLIGKWGDVRRSWDELRAMAIQRYTEQQKDYLNRLIKQNQRDLEDLESRVSETFGFGLVTGDAL